MLNFMTNETKECLEASSILINTFYDLEGAAIDALKAKNPNIYNVGPLQLLGRHFISEETRLSGSSLWKTDPECIQWLNKWGPNSVICGSDGCSTIMTDEHLREFAWGLADSKVPFLWVVRPDVTRTGEQYGDAHGNLPQEFLDEIKDRGYITSWSPQNQVLAHPAVGVFLSHCGWNSTIESVSEGKPMICWPFLLNNKPIAGMQTQLALVREAILGEKGKQMRQNGLQWKEKAIKATEVGGASYNDFKRFLKEALHFDA
ncbi:hypothetical protein L6164_003783 [Bauhinia variegata]|uniref:Uncharacterized protein n=1 Tax=Bauhinia variegata TaxID=167791 RepID=A0ACB9Q4E2_BAUVA|nr:hypothetical protein L6164_003783 [Bauhinia variegata]